MSYDQQARLSDETRRMVEEMAEDISAYNVACFWRALAFNEQIHLLLHPHTKERHDKEGDQ